MSELLAVALIAAVWWIPTFVCISDLQGRHGIRRVLVWKWWAILTVPVAGWMLYWKKARAELDRDAEQAKRGRR